MPTAGCAAQETPATPPAASQTGAAAKPLPGVDHHQRNPSAISVPESEISSSGTFIDKGSNEDVPTLMAAPKAEELEGPGDAGAALVAEEYAPLQPPESAFSSDMSEQHSGQVP